MSRSLLAVMRRRLILAGLGLTAVNILVIAFHYVDWQGLRREKIDEQVALLASALRPGAAGEPLVVLPDTLAERFREHMRAYAYRIQHADGRILAEANAGLIPPGLSPRDMPPTLATVTYGADGAATKAATRRVLVGGESVFVTFASAGDPARLTWGVFFDEIIGHVLLPLVPFALLLTLINLWTLRRSMAPLTEAAAAAGRITASGSLKPLPATGLPTEVRDLVDATNAALARLGHALEGERAFTAEAAHALRTPLSVLAARLETLPDGPGARDARAEAEALIRLVNQMLSAAQADTLVVDDMQRCDLAGVAAQVVAAMAPLAIRQGRRLALEAPASVHVLADADALAHALRNLIENAVRHTPEGAEVVVAVRDTGLVEVLDRGPGIPDAWKPLVTRRFWRAPGAGAGGTGLGLAIAQRIAEAHGSALTIADREGGGASVRFTARLAS